MSAELGIGLGVKLFGGSLTALIAGAFGHLYWSIRRDKTKLDNTYTKAETQQLIATTLEPTKQKVNEMSSVLQSLLEKVEKSNTETHTLLSEIKTNVAVVQNDIQHLKEKKEN